MKACIVFITLMFASSVDAALRIESSDDLQTGSFNVSSPDDLVPTLGRVSILIDLQAERDDVFELTIRRTAKLPDGRSARAFGFDRAADIVVIAAGEVARVSVAGVSDKEGRKEVLVLFHNQWDEVVAPESADIGVFNLAMQPRDFDYRPLLKPQAKTMPVNILLDTSGSMADVMDDAVALTRDFLGELPAFTRCGIWGFGSKVYQLTVGDEDALLSCPESQNVLNASIKAGGGTALFQALEQAFIRNASGQKALPKLVIVVTDGVDTQGSALSRGQLVALKQKHNARVFVFWAGRHNSAHLNGLSDLEITSGADVTGELGNFFDAIGVSVSGLQTLYVM